MPVLMVMAHGSESLESVTVMNVLRRVGLEVQTASIEPGEKTVRASRGIELSCDHAYADVAGLGFAMIVLPGGEAGARRLAQTPALIDQLKAQRQAHRWTAAICAAPALVLSPHGLLDGKQATCFPAFRDQLLHFVDRPVVVDGHCVTAQGPASAIAFALTLVEVLIGPAKRREVAQALLAE